MKNVFLFFCLILMVNSCDVESDCKACQEAINHMAEKISDYSCNPEYMQNAWDRIKKDCGSMGDTYVGYMVETCDYQSLDIPNCENQRMTVQSTEFVCTTTTGLPGDFDLTVQHSNSLGSENFVIKDMTQNEELFVVFPNKVNDRDEFTFTIWEFGTNVALASASETFKFERNHQWFDLREVDITFKEGSGYLIDFKNW